MKKLWVGLVLLGLISCQKETNLPSWDNRLLLPLMHTVIDPGDLVQDSNLIINANDYYSLKWNKELFRFAVDSLVEIPDTLFNNFFKPLISLTVQPGQKILDLTSSKVFGFGGANLTTLRIRSGQLKFEVVNTTSERILCTYTINSATRCGDTFTFTEVAPANSSTVFSTVYDFSGYTVDLRGVGLDSVNTVISNFKAWVHPDGQPVTLQPSDSFYINIQFIDLVLDYARGYFGSKTYEVGPESLPFDVFNSLQSGKLSFAQANFALNITNSFGVDVRMKLNSLEAFNSKKLTSLSLTSPLVGKTINISRATEYSPGMGFKAPTVYRYDLSGSNMKQIFEMFPDRFEYGMSISSNPLGNVSNNNDFMYYGQGVTASLEMDIPLAVRADSLLMEQRSTWNFKLGDTKNNYLGGFLDARFTNSFPFDARLTMLLLDPQGITIDTLLYEAHITAASTDAQGRLLQPVITTFKIEANRQRIDILESSRTILTFISFNTSHKPGFVSFYPEHTLEMSLIGDFNIRWNP